MSSGRPQHVEDRCVFRAQTTQPSAPLRQGPEEKESREVLAAHWPSKSCASCWPLCDPLGRGKAKPRVSGRLKGLGMRSCSPLAPVAHGPNLDEEIPTSM